MGDVTALGGMRRALPAERLSFCLYLWTVLLCWTVPMCLEGRQEVRFKIKWQCIVE